MLQQIIRQRRVTRGPLSRVGNRQVLQEELSLRRKGSDGDLIAWKLRIPGRGIEQLLRELAEVPVSLRQAWHNIVEIDPLQESCTFEVDEEESLVFYDGTADGKTVLIAAQRLDFLV